MTTTREAGKKGAQMRNQKLSAKERSEASKKAAATRKQHDPQSFSKMGQKGGSQSHKNDKNRES